EVPLARKREAGDREPSSNGGRRAAGPLLRSPDATTRPGMQTLRIGTRKSPLAMWQAEYVRDRLLAAHDDLEVELVPIETKGDKILDVALSRVGGKGLFVKELEVALLEGRV